MIIVTGGAGFIGSNIIAGLNKAGKTDILVVDNLTKSKKFLNLVDLQFSDFMDKEDFFQALKNNRLQDDIEAVYHQGACSDTMEYDGRYMMHNNYEHSKAVLDCALAHKAPFIYASSASVYGASTVFREEAAFESPLNVYGYSKLLFDRYVQRQMDRFESTVAGLRYFNVYGPKEQHKDRMASMVHQMYYQLSETGIVRLFEGSGGYGAGEQRRDFISVSDIVSVNLNLAEGPVTKGVFNVGTGTSRSFNDIANNLIRQIGKGSIEYVPMPEVLRDKYQNFTEADISRLRQAGYTKPMTTLEDGVESFADAIKAG